MAYYCLVNHERRFIACVDPKCGSYTIRDWFNHTLPDPVDDPDRNYSSDMIPAETVADHDGYRKIFVVRDPLRRLVSFYHHWVVLDEDLWCFADRDGEIGLRGRSFADLLNILDDLSSRGVPFQHHLEPQTRVLGAIDLDDVVRLEDLDTRIDEINAGLGVDYRPPRLNAREYGHETLPGAGRLTPEQLRRHGPVSLESFYDPELRDVARRVYADDVDFYEAHSPAASAGTEPT